MSTNHTFVQKNKLNSKQNIATVRESKYIKQLHRYSFSQSVKFHFQWTFQEPLFNPKPTQ